MEHRPPLFSRLDEQKLSPAPRDDTVTLAPLPAPAAGTELDLRQLRHHTSNTWQRMLCEVAMLAGSAATPAERRIAGDIQRRIAATAAVADALFGFTAAPAPLPERLDSLCRNLLAAQGDARQSVAVTVEAVGELAGELPAGLCQTLLRVAQEMVGNAIKHGLHARLAGRLSLRLEATAAAVTLRVRDDGWGPPARPQAGGGTALMRELAAAQGGRITLARHGGETDACLILPWPDAARRWDG